MGIHAGTHMDQGNLDIELTSDTMNSLLSLGLLSDAFIRETNLQKSKKKKKALYHLHARDLDIIHTVLSRVDSSSSAGSASLSRPLGDKYLGSDSKGLKDTLIRLIDIAVRSVRRDEKSKSSTSAASSSRSSS